MLAYKITLHGRLKGKRKTEKSKRKEQPKEKKHLWLPIYTKLMYQTAGLHSGCKGMQAKHY